MSQNQKWFLSVIAAAIAILAFVLLRADSNDNDPQPAQGTTTLPSTTGDPPATATAPTAEPAPPAPPPYVRIRAKGLKPVGKIKQIKVNAGDTVRFEVRSDQAEEAHLHGYDISKAVGPGKRARFKFKANIEGIFELELEHAGVPIGELQVNP